MKPSLRLPLALLATLALATACKKDEPKPGAPLSAGDKIVEGAKQVGQGIAEGAKAAWDSTKEGAKVVAAEASDSWITSKIKGKIGVGRLFKVSVDTNAGVVTLTGLVKTLPEVDEIEKLARETDGVKQVLNRLAVAPAAPVAPLAPPPAAAPAAPPALPMPAAPPPIPPAAK